MYTKRKLFIRSNKCEVWLDVKSIDQYWRNPPVQVSKLISYALVSPINLVFIYHLEDHHFQFLDFFSFYFKFKIHDNIKMAHFHEFLTEHY